LPPAEIDRLGVRYCTDSDQSSLWLENSSQDEISDIVKTHIFWLGTMATIKSDAARMISHRHHHTVS